MTGMSIGPVRAGMIAPVYTVQRKKRGTGFGASCCHLTPWVPQPLTLSLEYLNISLYSPLSTVPASPIHHHHPFNVSITSIPFNARRVDSIAEILHCTSAVRTEVAGSPHLLPSYRRALPVWVWEGVSKENHRSLETGAPWVCTRLLLERRAGWGHRNTIHPTGSEGCSRNTRKPGRVGSLCLVARGNSFFNEPPTLPLECTKNG